MNLECGKHAGGGRPDWDPSTTVIFVLEIALLIVVVFAALHLINTGRTESPKSGDEVGASAGSNGSDAGSDYVAESDRITAPYSIEGFLITALTSLVVAGPMALIVSRRQKRKDYQYARSRYITQKVFLKEYKDIVAMSEALYKLIIATKDHCADQPSEAQSTEHDLRYEEACDKVRELLACSAFSLFYINDDAKSYCGVEKKRINANSSGSEELCLICDHSPEGLSKLTAVSVGEKTLFEKALEIYLKCKSWSKNNSQLNAADCLDICYRCFLNCARCRIRSIEMGTKDTQRRNFFDKMPLHIIARNIAQGYNDECPFEKKEYPDSRTANDPPTHYSLEQS